MRREIQQILKFEAKGCRILAFLREICYNKEDYAKGAPCHAEIF